jgi:hypothetical protein
MLQRDPTTLTESTGMRHLPVLLLLLTGLCQASAANLELRAMTNADQAARKSDATDWDALSKEDAKRRTRVKEMLAAGTIASAEDFYNAALIMQHGDNAQDFKLAFSLASISATIDPEGKSFTPAYKSSKWLTAAAWDRHLMNIGKPQWYGTQFTRRAPNLPWELYQCDENAVSDEERKALGVPTRDEIRAKLEQMNKPR